MSKIVLHESLDPDTPASDAGHIYYGFDKCLYLKDDAGEVRKLADALGISGWACISGSIVTAKNGSTAPTMTAFGPSGTLEMPAFAIGDTIHLQFKLPPSAKADGLQFAVIEFTTDGTDTNEVKFDVLNTKAVAGEAFGANVAFSLEAEAAGVAWEVAQILGTEVTGGGPNEHIIVSVERVTNGATDNTDDIFPLTFDLWFEVDKTVAEDHPT